jgi:hypothetical protein
MVLNDMVSSWMHEEEKLRIHHNEKDKPPYSHLIGSEPWLGKKIVPFGIIIIPEPVLASTY